MGSEDVPTTLGNRVAESWLSTLEVNAAFDRPWVEQAIGWLAAPSTGSTAAAVDVGCGAGGAACAFAHHVGPGGAPVVALDRDPRLIGIARPRAEAEGVADHRPPRRPHGHRGPHGPRRPPPLT